VAIYPYAPLEATEQLISLITGLNSDMRLQLIDALPLLKRAMPFPSTVTAQDLFARFLDPYKPVTRYMIELLSQVATDPQE
jgi:hypothetical protein